MNKIYTLRRSYLFFIIFLCMANGAYGNETPANYLSLEEAEQLSINVDPLTMSFEAHADSLTERAVADGQLPDPKFKFGIMNLPVDTFDRGQEPMTQLQFGIQQSFPRGRTLHYKSSQTTDMAKVDRARAKNRERIVLRSLRRAYLELYLQQQTESILEQNRNLFSQLLEITQRQYAIGRDNQHDVLRAQLELSLLDDLITEVIGARESAVAELARWIKHEHAQRPLSQEFPRVNTIPPLDKIIANLPEHPLIHVEDALVDANDKNINIAEEQYKPGWMLDLTFGERTGDNLDGSSRSDFASAMVLVDIPIFTDKRQDKYLAASKLQTTASRFARSDRLLELRQQVEKEYAQWLRLGDRYEIYQNRATVDAEQNSVSTLKAYQNDLTDFTTLMRARLTELDTQLDMLKIRINQAKSQANLLYYVREKL